MDKARSSITFVPFHEYFSQPQTNLYEQTRSPLGNVERAAEGKACLFKRLGGHALIETGFSTRVRILESCIYTHSLTHVLDSVNYIYL